MTLKGKLNQGKVIELVPSEVRDTLGWTVCEGTWFGCAMVTVVTALSQIEVTEMEPCWN